MPMKPSTGANRSSLLGRLRRVISHSSVGRGWRRSSDLALGQRALGFAALGFLTLVPLLIIVSSGDPQQGHGFAQWLGEGLGVSTASREQVEELFTRPGQALRTTTAFGIAALAAFGLTFAAAVQAGYEKIWDLPPARWWARWRHVVWLCVLTGYLFVSATTTLRREPLAGGAIASLRSRCHTDHGVCRSNGSLDRVIAGTARHESRTWRYTGKIQGSGRPRAATVGRYELAPR
ncbi:hypothetical protein ACFU5O_35400 [Streptomyces sp. NPDC057445]|uniref:hypothetical protein n=1 Tax=Streptomyces sp. NPDC057445 TaxID=3346136 RepID=UPI0036D164E0